MNIQLKRATGSYYTCSSVADFIASWAITDRKSIVLEPSFGDGSFLNAAIKRFASLEESTPNITGIELQSKPFTKYIKSKSLVKGYNIDFMEYASKEKYDAVIGNPPYVSIKSLKLSEKANVMSLMEKYRYRLSANSSMWVPFIVHSTELLKIDGRMGFVLPYELTYVRYAFDLWKYLCENFQDLSVLRIHDDFFPEVDVETIIFLAAGKGGHTSTINYKVYPNLSSLYTDSLGVNYEIDVKDILCMKKPFESMLISDETHLIINRLRESKKIKGIISDCKFKIGYVCGNKQYFHPSKEIIEKYNINTKNLIPCITSGKEISDIDNLGIDTCNISSKTSLFYPLNISNGEQAYINYGEEIKVHEGYKCKKRKPWYITPETAIPDVILTVFGDIPRLLSNTGKYIISNTLLGGFLVSDASSKDLACRWYNSLTLLFVEIYIHSLGGGTLVFIPGETDKMEILSDFPKSKVDETYQMLNDCMLQKGIEKTYELGDKLVLKDIYNLSKKEIDEIKASVEYLRSWRKPDKRR